MDDWAITMVLVAIGLGMALLVLFVGWLALAVSGREEEDQQRWIRTMAAVGRQEWPAGEASANGDYPASADGPDYSDGSESDHG